MFFSSRFLFLIFDLATTLNSMWLKFLDVEYREIKSCQKVTKVETKVIKTTLKIFKCIAKININCIYTDTIFF